MSYRSILTVAFLVASPSLATAHGIGIEARLKGDRVHVEAFFDDDTPAADAKVMVARVDGQTVLEGKTDAKGLWSFSIPQPGKYRVTVNAGAGHLAKTTISIPEAALRGEHNPLADSASNGGNAASEILVSDGPTRAAVTGNRWLMGGAGLAIMSLFMLGFWQITRRKPWGQTLGTQR